MNRDPILAEASVWADGSGYVQVRRNGKLIHEFHFGSENEPEPEAPAESLAVIREAAERWLKEFDLIHMKCNGDSDTECYAEQYGAGEAGDHAFARELRPVLEGSEVEGS